MYEKVGLKCRLKRIQLHRLENVGLKASLDSSQPDILKCLKIPRFGCLPDPLQKLWFKQIFGFEPAGRSRMSWNPKVSVPCQTIANTEGLTVLLIFFVLWGGIREKAQRDKQVDLSKTEVDSETPMTQLGRAATSSAIINHVWFVSLSVFYFNRCQ